MLNNSANFEVIDNAAERRFELRVEEATGFLTYALRGGSTIVLFHTEVPPAIEGKGVGGALVRAALERACREKLTVLPRCSFAAAYISEHPEYADLVAPA